MESQIRVFVNVMLCFLLVVNRVDARTSDAEEYLRDLTKGDGPHSRRLGPNPNLLLHRYYKYSKPMQKLDDELKNVYDQVVEEPFKRQFGSKSNFFIYNYYNKGSNPVQKLDDELENVYNQVVEGPFKKKFGPKQDFFIYNYYNKGYKPERKLDDEFKNVYNQVVEGPFKREFEPKPNFFVHNYYNKGSKPMHQLYDGLENVNYQLEGPSKRQFMPNFFIHNYYDKGSKPVQKRNDELETRFQNSAKTTINEVIKDDADMSKMTDFEKRRKAKEVYKQ